MGKRWRRSYDLANKVLEVLDTKESKFKVLYDENDTIENKINTIAKEIYGADSVIIDPKAKKEIARLEGLGYDKLPVCIAKTQYSLSDNPALLADLQDLKLVLRR